MASTSSLALPLNYKLGEYQIQSVLGHGGFGITYLAKDVRLGSLVAIKEFFPQAFAWRDQSESTIHPNTGDTTSDAENYRWGLNAFLEEAQALAKFKHPHIVRVLRFMEANGTAYLVMEYEEGESLAGWLRKHGGFLDEPMLLNVFLPILTGLQAVHDAGLLHLDIKPDNIYLRANGQPMLIDFGSARQFQSGSDASQRVALSRGYAALEQYPGKGDRGPWSDVYGVGASLYRCITGKEPVDSLEREATFAKKRVDPLVPATRFERPLYSKHIREAVDAATRLAAAERPQTARALQNGLMGKGIKDEKAQAFVPYGRGAGFIGVSAAAEKKRRRGIRRGPLEKLIAVLVFVATFIVVIPKLMVDLGYLAQDDLYNRIGDWRNRLYETGREIDERVFGVKSHAVEAAPRAPLARPAAEKPAPTQTIVPFDSDATVTHTIDAPIPAVSLAFLRGGRLLAGALENGTVQIWDADSGDAVRTLIPKTAAPGVVAVSADGRWLAMTAEDHGIALWDAEKDSALVKLPGHTDTITALAFSPDGKLLASAGEDQQVILWDLAGRQRAMDPLPTRAAVSALAFAPNGRVLSAADAAGGVQSWEMPGGKEMSYFIAQDDAVTSLAYAPDGKWMATGGRKHFLKLWSAGVERNDRRFDSAPETVQGLAFTPDRQWLLAVGTDEAIHLWKLDDGSSARLPRAHNHDIYAVAVSPDGHLFATAGDDDAVRLWK